MRLHAVCVLLALGLLGQAQTVPVTFAWNLDPTHDGPVTWEVEIDGADLVPCGTVVVVGAERRCTALSELGEHLFRVRGTASGDDGPLIGAWSDPVTATISGTPGAFTISVHWEASEDPDQPMAISFIGSAIAESNTLTMPTHAAGDVILVFAYSSSDATPATPPEGWTTIGTPGGANSNSLTAAYRVAVDASTPLGTWESLVTHIAVAVYRGASGVGGNGRAGTVSASISYPAIGSGTGAVAMSVTDGSSWVVGVGGHRSSGSTSIGTPPTGMTNREALAARFAFHDTNGGVSGWSAQSVEASTSSSGTRSVTVEIVAATGGGGLSAAILNHYYRQMQGN